MPLILLAASASCAFEEPADPAGAPPPERGTEAPVPAPPPAGGAVKGSAITAVVTDIRLSPAAMVQAEKFMCVCGCEMILAECSCEEEPGGMAMKKHLQGLVDLGLSPAAIAEDMVATYGSAVLP